MINAGRVRILFMGKRSNGAPNFRWKATLSSMLNRAYLTLCFSKSTLTTSAQHLIDGIALNASVD